MNNHQKTTRFTLWVNRIIFGAVFILLFTLPMLLNWYSAIRLLQDHQETAITVAFYLCSVAVLYALWSMDRLLRNLLEQQVFTEENVSLIRRVCLCCGAVALICLPAGWFYPPLIFLCVIMGFLALVVSVVCQVMDAAVKLREENDLTI